MQAYLGTYALPNAFSSVMNAQSINVSLTFGNRFSSNTYPSGKVYSTKYWDNIYWGEKGRRSNSQRNKSRRSKSINTERTKKSITSNGEGVLGVAPPLNLHVKALYVTDVLGFIKETLTPVCFEKFNEIFYPELKTSPKIAQLPSDILTRAMVGASLVPPNAVVPYHVSIQDEDENHVCGGTIITDELILTAGHCFPDSLTAENTIVLIGTVDLKHGGMRYQAKRFIIHPQYGLDPFEINDIGLVVLKRKIRFSRTVQPIAISRETIPSDAELLVVGWGSLIFDGPTPQHLRYLKVNAVVLDKCQQYYDDMDGVKVKLHSSQFCTLTCKGEGCCHGDSGGGLVFNNTVFGVVSLVAKTCAIGMPDVHVDVSQFYDWIIEITLQHHATSKSIDHDEL